jgi:hypothetical protein
MRGVDVKEAASWDEVLVELGLPRSAVEALGRDWEARRKSPATVGAVRKVFLLRLKETRVRLLRIQALERELLDGLSSVAALAPALPSVAEQASPDEDTREGETR